jgi:hypothetical protein
MVSCLSYGYPKHIATHLQDQHPNVPVAERRAIAAAA